VAGFYEKFAGFAECRKYMYWIGNCQLFEKDSSVQLAGLTITVVHLPGDRLSWVAFFVCCNR